MALDNLTNLQWASLSRRLSQDKQRVPLALTALKRHYSEKGLADDYILNTAFVRAEAGLQSGQISDEGVVRAIEGYAAEYEEALAETTLKDITQSAENAGYKVPGEFAEYMRDYENDTYVQLAEKAKAGDKKAERLFEGIRIIEQGKFEGVLYPQLIKELTDSNLKHLAESTPRNNQPSE